MWREAGIDRYRLVWSPPGTGSVKPQGVGTGTGKAKGSSKGGKEKAGERGGREVSNHLVQVLEKKKKKKK